MKECLRKTKKADANLKEVNESRIFLAVRFLYLLRLCDLRCFHLHSGHRRQLDQRGYLRVFLENAERKKNIDIILLIMYVNLLLLMVLLSGCLFFQMDNVGRHNIEKKRQSKISDNHLLTPIEMEKRKLFTFSFITPLRSKHNLGFILHERVWKSEKRAKEDNNSFLPGN